MPLTNPTARKGYSFGPFYDLLVEKFPVHLTQQGVFDVKRLSEELGMTNETVYRMLRNDQIQPKAAAALIKLSKSESKRLKKSKNPIRVTPLTKLDLLDYVIPDNIDG